MTEVATKKLLENDRVIVWELLLQPGEETGMHTHEHDYIVHVIEGSTLRATDPQDSPPKDIPLAAGDTFYFRVADGVALAGDLETSTTHNAENVGPGVYREIMVEVK